MNYIERFIKAQIMVIYGVGLLYLAQLAGFSNLTVQGINISPSQAEVIQNHSDYWTDNQQNIIQKKRR